MRRASGDNVSHLYLPARSRQNSTFCANRRLFWTYRGGKEEHAWDVENNGQRIQDRRWYLGLIWWLHPDNSWRCTIREQGPVTWRRFPTDDSRSVLIL